MKLRPPYPPMEAELVDEIPTGDLWQYEPKWDGFRCLAFRDDGEIYLQSKAGQPLGRYFPDITEALASIKAKQFVLDGELVIPVGDELSFDDLLLRLHPAASRVQKLASEHPAMFIVFDLLLDEKGKLWVNHPLRERRPILERFFARFCKTCRQVRLSPATVKRTAAQKWFKSAGPALDGVIAKRMDVEYRSGERDGVQKTKNYRSADCVVGGFRYEGGGRGIGSLLLGLYDDEGLLHHVGFCSGLSTADRRQLAPKLEKLIQPPGFTGRAPGGPSRWTRGRQTEWQPLSPKLVVEVSYDHVTGGRFRHGTRLLRWRPDKDPSQCTMEQLAQSSNGLMKLLN